MKIEIREDPDLLQVNSICLNWLSRRDFDFEFFIIGDIKFEKYFLINV
jgi:hypothetical protein